MVGVSLSALLKQRALESGFDLVGIAPLAAWRDLEFSRKWVEQGFGGEMRYLQNPKRDDPRRLLPSVRSVICVGLTYNTDYPYSTEVGSGGAKSQESEVRRKSQDHLTPASSGQFSTFDFRIAKATAWISRYAWGKDYHEVMRTRLEKLCAAIEALAPGTETRAYVDTGPVVERAFARFSGIGWMGKNTCLINQEKGSWFFLGVLLTSLEVETDFPAPDRCGTCTRCLEACPTGALVKPYVMDATRCISYLNIELKGSIPEEFRSAMGMNVFGCDICQDVCPWNAKGRSQESVRQLTDRSQESSFQPLSVSLQKLETGKSKLGRSPRADAAMDAQPATHIGLRTTDNLQSSIVNHQSSGPDTRHPKPDTFSLFAPPLEALATITEEDFRRVFRQSPIKRTKYRGWLRNLCVAMGNSGDLRSIPWLEHARHHSDAVVREHAEWALERLKSKEAPRVEGTQPLS
jgi:epoxyqueuosine reductase